MLTNSMKYFMDGLKRYLTQIMMKLEKLDLRFLAFSIILTDNVLNFNFIYKNLLTERKIYKSRV